LKRLALLILLGAAVIAGCGGGGDDSSGTTTAASLSSCNIDGRKQELGASYVTSIDVAKVSCGRAEKVVLAYHHCRIANGGAGGTCNTPVMSFNCTEGPRQSVPGVQFNATADCRSGVAEIKSTYTQNF
jgi:hypothetical protein